MQITISPRAIKRFALLILVAASMLAIVWIVQETSGEQLPDQLASSKHDAVTLTDGSIYFGDLQPPLDGYNELRHAHRLIRDVEDKDSKEQKTKVVSVTQDAIQPRSSMFFSSDEIVAVQELQSKSIISKVIDKSTK